MFHLPQSDLIFSWSDYCNRNINDEQIIEKQNFTSSEQRLNFSSGDAYVFNCYFQGLHSQVSAGAIVFSYQEGYFLIEKCSFLDCSTEDFTAAVRVGQGNSIFAFVCGQYCQANSNDGFSSVANSDSTRKYNSVYDSTISYCKATENYILFHYYGPILMKSLNCSHNNAKTFSSVGCARLERQSVMP